LKIALLIVSIFVSLLVGFQTTLTEYESISIGLAIYWMISFLLDLGKKLVFLDIIIVSAILSCLVMPIIGYHYFSSENALAVLWQKNMVVTSNVYFDFMVPATIALILGLKMPVFFTKKIDSDHLLYRARLINYVGKMKWEGLILVVIGILATLLQSFVPSSLSHAFFLMNYMLFIGVFYCVFSDFPLKKLVLWSSFAVLILRSILQGMFGELLFMAVMASILLLLGKKTKFISKIAILMLASIVILIVQMVKPEYRKKIWYKNDNAESEVSIFIDLVNEKFDQPEVLFKNEAVWFGIYARFNQGLYIGLVQRAVPNKYPYANGETINESIIGAIVPRLLWPDKQTAGGVYNFKRFLGFNLVGYSIGLSPYGEAWGNYGRTGGIIFMFFFGLMFNFIFAWILKIAVGTPSLILWLPLIFFYAVKIETDVFSMVNSLFKACMFTFIMYKIYPLFFRGKL
jgi:hypothetical protein